METTDKLLPNRWFYDVYYIKDDEGNLALVLPNITRDDVVDFLKGIYTPGEWKIREFCTVEGGGIDRVKWYYGYDFTGARAGSEDEKTNIPGGFGVKFVPEFDATPEPDIYDVRALVKRYRSYKGIKALERALVVLAGLADKGARIQFVFENFEPDIFETDLVVTLNMENSPGFRGLYDADRKNHLTALSFCEQNEQEE